MVNVDNIKFQSYCWSLGTTSFRVKDLNFKIERQLQLLNKLWEQTPKGKWNGNDEIQEKYYNLMLENKFITGDAKNKPKDARQKTSGLVQIGVIDSNRKITEIGNKIIEIIESENFEDDNIFNIHKDSFIYLKQLLKLQITDNGINIKPFIVLLYLLANLKTLSREEFTYLLPLCTTKETTYKILEYINEYRNKKITIEDIIQKKMLSMDNYKTAIEYIKENGINNIDDFSIIDMNRKGKKYVELLYKFYEDLYKVINRPFDEEAFDVINNFIIEQTNRNSKVASYWKKYLKYTSRTIMNEYLDDIKKIPIFKCKDKTDYTIEFFKVMHTAKWKATLEDYADLNKRYLSLADIIIFDNDKIELELFPKYYFLNIADSLMETKILDNGDYENFIAKDIEFKKIYDCLDVNIDNLIKQIHTDYPEIKLNTKTLKTFIKDERLKRFNELIDKKFSDENLIYLFEKIETNDKKSRENIYDFEDWNSDIPTIFEYILGITWYKISNRSGNILEFMKLSLDANLLPKTHAAGGTADIVYEYEKAENYPEHKALIEATLTESTSQRKSEMEPVSRHLMREIQENDNPNSYAIFVANILREEVLSDFRSRRNYEYRVNGKVEKGLKIISLSIEDIIYLIKIKVQYKTLYKIFDEAYKDTKINDLDWYKKLIKNKINNL